MLLLEVQVLELYPFERKAAVAQSLDAQSCEVQFREVQSPAVQFFRVVFFDSDVQSLKFETPICAVQLQ